jgi:hypothetical protein
MTGTKAVRRLPRKYLIFAYVEIRKSCADLRLMLYFRYFPGALGEIRTPDPQIRNLMLYPAELRAPRPAQ